MRIRLATEADAPLLTGLIAGFRDWLRRSQPADGVIHTSLQSLLAEPDTEFLVAERDGGTLLGFLQQRYRLTVWTGAPEAWLEDLYVMPAERGAGIGRSLVEAALERARARNCKSIALDTNEQNAAAVSLYESLGFTSGKGGGDGRQLLLHRQL